MEYIFGENLRYSKYGSVDGGYTIYSVYGEDPNCDFGGSHTNPFLGRVEGTFKDVLEYAANNMGGFYQWGSGGYVHPSTKSKPIIANESKRLKLERRKKLLKLMYKNVDSIIENVDSMTKDEIKEALRDLKEF